MSHVMPKNTTTEVAIRRLIFGMGYRYRLHDKSLPGKPDLVFRGRRKVIFINGCFWHGHIDCRYGRLPKSRVRYWREKISKNKERDKRNIESLAENDWKSLTIWQCELKDIEKLKKKINDFIDKE